MAYPDAGEGPYAKKLSYKDWYNFGILQSIHQNYARELSFANLSVLCAGSVDGNYGIAVGVGFMLGK
jgi:hypothetical protein